MNFLTDDHLGSTRLVTDGSGNVLRCSDYLPFGEEIPAGMGGRTGCYGSGQYPTPPDVESLKFTGKERDSETGLDFFESRYYSSAQGRFTSPDEFKGGGVFDPGTGKSAETIGPLPYADITDPQTLNKYAYVRNNPLRYVDPDGHCVEDLCVGEFLLGAAAVHATAQFISYLQTPSGQDSARAFVQGTGALINKAADAISSIFHKDPSPPAQGQQGQSEQQTGQGQQGSEQAHSNTNPYTGPVTEPVTVVDQKGNAIPVATGQSITASPDGRYQQVRDKQGNQTGDRLDAGGHRGQADPRAQAPHAHRPGVTTPDGNPHLPINQ
jgi:RHS repeat-associated protein